MTPMPQLFRGLYPTLFLTQPLLSYKQCTTPPPRVQARSGSARTSYTMPLAQLEGHHTAQPVQGSTSRSVNRPPVCVRFGLIPTYHALISKAIKSQ